MKKALLVFVALLTLTAGLFAQYGYGNEKQIEFFVTGGYGLGSLNGTSEYADTWSAYILNPVNESDLITLQNKNSFSLGIGLTYYLSPNFGIQIGGGYFAPKADVFSDWNINWHWTSSGETFSDAGSWDAIAEGAKLTSIPLYLNLVGRYDTGTFGLYASAGPAVFFNNFSADSSSIYGDYGLLWIFEFIDWFDIPVFIPETKWTGFGFDAGAGFDIKFSPSVAFVVDARYFYCGKKDLFWTFQPGTYSGFNGILEYTYDDLTGADEHIGPLSVNPSFFSITGGLKLFF